MSKYAAIRGWGMYAPERVLTNADMATFVDTSDEWIRTRTGISGRHIVADDETTSTLATHAARQALAQADLPASELDLIIVATCTPDFLLPSTSCLVQNALGAGRAAAFDLGAVCSGFVYGLVTATQFIQAGSYRNVLVIGAELLSRFVNYKDRTTCVLFGDGAGAVLLQACDEPYGVLSFVLNAQGAGSDLLKIPAGGSAAPGARETVPRDDYYIRMSGGEVYQFAVRAMSEDTLGAMKRAGVAQDDVSLFVPHQANVRIIEAVARRLDVPMDKVAVNIDRMGNTSSASVPMALCEAVAAGRVHPGDNLVFAVFGSGLTSGAAVIRWGWPA